MPDFQVIMTELGWPLAIAIAWLSGEFIHRWARLPRISVYGVVGFVLAQAFPAALTSGAASTVTTVANLAFGLILFEFGYRINLRWLRMCVVMSGNPYTESGEVFKVPDMLANRADIYNLGDTLSNLKEIFDLSYIENSLTSNPVLAPLASISGTLNTSPDSV